MESVHPPRASSDRRLWLWGGALRGDPAAGWSSLLSLHALPAPHGGTAASASASPAPGSFRIVKGESELRAWRPEGGFEKCFCGERGSAVFSRDPESHDAIVIRLGSFDSDPGVRPEASVCRLRGVLGGDSR